MSQNSLIVLGQENFLATSAFSHILIALMFNHLQTAKYAKLTEVVLTRRQAKQYDAETMKLAAALLELNPDVYTAWNFRREALTETLQGSTDTSNEQKV